VIPPGGQGKVTASIDSARFKGPISKSVTLYSNDPAKERTILSLKAEILVAIDVRPRDRVILRGKVAEQEPTVLQLVASDGQAFDILAVEKRSDDLEISIVPAPALQGEKAPKKPKLNKEAVASGHSAYEMTVKVSPTAKPGRMADRIRLTTTHPKMAAIDVSVSGKLDGDLTVQPERLFFLSSRGGTAAQRQELTLAKRPKGGLEVKSVTTTDATFEAKVIPVSEGKEYKIEVLRTADAIGTQSQAQLVIMTNDPLQPRIEVPLLAR
jgi:hypothetical protein